MAAVSQSFLDRVELPVTLSQPAEQEQKIAQIRERCMAELAEALKTAIASNERGIGKLQERMRVDGPFAEEMFSALYEQGRCPLTGYAQAHFQNDQTEALSYFINRWYQRVEADFARGDRRSFSPMAEWIGKQQISAYFPPPPNLVKEPLNQLKKMASLKVPEAKNQLSLAYQFNSIGQDQVKTALNLTQEERLRGLWELTESQHSASQSSLESIYSNQTMGKKEKVTFSEEERGAALKKLAGMQVGLRGSVTQYMNGPLNMFTVEERIEGLTQKAMQGDKESLRPLWRLYTLNQLGNPIKYTLVDLDLTKEKRWEKLRALRVPGNQDTWDQLYAKWILERGKGSVLPFEMTNAEGLEKLEALNSRGLAKFYAENQWGADFLRIPLAKRLEKLESLARKGSLEAMDYLMGYHLQLPGHVLKEAKIRPDETPENISYQEAPAAALPGAIIYSELNQRARPLLDIAVEMQEAHYCDQIIRYLQLAEDKRVVIKTIFSHLNTIKSVC